MKNRGKSRNGGYSIVTTLVAISFVTVLGVIVMSVSSVNLRMKYMDKKARADFYQGETVLDDIYNGIGMDVASAVSQSYSEIMRNASNGMQIAYDTEEEAYEAFLTSLRNRMDRMFVSPDGGLTEVDLAALMEQYIRVNAEGGSREAKVTVPALPADRIIQEKDKSGKFINYIFRDVSVAYRDGKGNQATLTADIVVDFPYIDFFRKHDNIFDYAMAANKGIYLNGNPITINGNIYAGTSPLPDSADYGERDVYGGINLAQGTKASIQAKYIVTRGNITVRDGAILKIAGIGGPADRANIWAETLRTAKQDPRNMEKAEISILANTYLANDLELNSDKSEVKLEGAYYGFNNKTYVTNEGKEIGGEGNQPDHTKSSSIVVNGRECKLDLKGLDTLMVAGRGYLDFLPLQPAITGVSYPSGEYATGESMGFRSDQFIWLAPAEYLKCPNPASWETLQALIPDVTEADLAQKVLYRDADGNFAGGWFGTMKSMVDKASPVKAVKIGRGGSAVYYFYLNFSSGGEKKYLEYIISATDANQEDPYMMQAFAIKEKMQQRILEDTENSIKLADDCRIYGLGSLIRTETDGGSRIESVAETAAGSNYAQVLGLGEAMATSNALNKRYTWMIELLDAKEEYPLTADLNSPAEQDYQARVSKDPAGLPHKANSGANSTYLPLSKYVDFESIKINGVKSEADKDAVVTKDNYVVTSDCKGIILSAGDVTVGNGVTVKGLILAAGKIYLENNAKVISDRGYAQAVLDRMLRKPDAATDINNISRYFVDYKPVSRESITVDTMSNEYLNWMSYRNFRKG